MGKTWPSGLLATAAVPTGSAQADVPIRGAKAQRMVALDRARPPAVRTRPVVAQIALQLLLQKRLLELPEYGFGVPEGKSNVLHLVAPTTNGVNGDGEGLRRGPLNANLNGDLHLHTFPGMAQPKRQACD